MKREQIFLSAETQEKLVFPEKPNAPDWFHQVKSPLTLVPFATYMSPRLFEVFIGNSGLKFHRFIPNAPMHMDYVPNGDANPERAEFLEGVHNAGIWTLAFLRFLEWYAGQDQSQRVHAEISETTNPKMMGLIKKQLGNLNPSALTVFPLPKFLQGNNAGVFDTENIQFKIRVGALLHATCLPQQQNWILQMHKMYGSLVGKVIRVNPRLKRQPHLDPDSGNPVYLL